MWREGPHSLEHCNTGTFEHWNTATLQHWKTATLNNSHSNHNEERFFKVILFMWWLKVVWEEFRDHSASTSGSAGIPIYRVFKKKIKSVFLKGLWRPFNFFDLLSAISSELLLRVQECAHKSFKANFHIHPRCKCFVLSKKTLEKKLKFSILLSEKFLYFLFFVDILWVHALRHEQISFLGLSPSSINPPAFFIKLLTPFISMGIFLKVLAFIPLPTTPPDKDLLKKY